MKPNPSIFRAALELVSARPEESLMVGDSVRQDIDGALKTGMQAVLVHRAHEPHPEEQELAARGVAIVRSLRDIPSAVARS
jgi:putative hydrolase of the HAD superfamily